MIPKYSVRVILRNGEGEYNYEGVLISHETVQAELKNSEFIRLNDTYIRVSEIESINLTAEA